MLRCIPRWLVWRSQISIDLCPLQSAGEVGVTNLGLGVEFVDLPSAFPVPVARLFYSTEGEVRLCSDGWCVDVRNSVVQLVQSPERSVDVPRVDRRRQSVLHVVVHRKSLIRVLDPDHGKNRTEDLFLLEPATRLDVRKNRRPVEVALRQLVRTFSAGHQFRAFRLTNVDVGLDLSDCILVDQRSDIRPLLPSVSKLESLGAVLEHAEELIVNLLLDYKTTGSGTTLPGRAKCAPQRAFEREIQIGIVHHDLSVLPSHLEREALVESATSLADKAPCFG